MHDKIQKSLAITDLVIIVLVAVLALGVTSDDEAAIAFIIFFSVLVNIIVFWRQRIPIVLLAIGLLLMFRVLTVEAFIDYAHINVIAFLLGMMIVVAFLEEKGVFDALLGILMSRFGGSAERFFVATMLMAALSAALVDEVSSILFMCAIVLKAAKKYEVNPAPFIMSVVFATNVGSSFTLLGNPVGVLIAFEGNLTFFDFVVWALPVGLAVLGLTVVLTMWLFRKDLAAMDARMRAEAPLKTTIYRELLGHPELRLPLAIFGATIAGLVVHHPMEILLGLETNTLLLGIPLAAAAISLASDPRSGPKIIESRVQWTTLIFFIFFFGVTGALEASGVTQMLAGKLVEMTGGSMLLAIVALLWLAGIMSAFMDNVLAVATITPIVVAMAPGNFPLWWALLFGACYMGNLTVIGSTANIVAHTYYEKEGGRTITFFEWLKPGFVVAMAQMLLATALMVLIHVYLFPGAGP
jgi:Na+/H+ antiporter NhaD/arsenite permease-like protein